jgi:choline-sulfatase
MPTSIGRREFIETVAGGVALGSFAAPEDATQGKSQDKTSRKPNILVLMSDQHTPFITGCYGDSSVQTPNLDRLATEGVTFDAAYCNSPLCVPSRLSMLSGKHPCNIGVWCLGDTMRSDTPTWPMMLSIAGYKTALSGRMHLVWPDHNHGFEEVLCPEKYTSVKNQFGYWKEPNVYNALSGHSVADARVGTTVHDDKDQSAEEHAIAFIREHATGNDARPFALCASFYRPHPPFMAPQELADLYSGLDPDVSGSIDDLPPIYRSIAAHFDLIDWKPTNDEAQRAIRFYYAMVTGVDQRIGRILKAIEDTGQLENTIVIYTSDHGESLGRHGLWFKSVFYEYSARVPLIIRYPSRFQRGARIASPVSLVDLFPTLCELAGVEIYPFLDGSSLVPALENGSIDENRCVFSEYSAYGLHEPTRMVRQGKFKLMYARTYDPVLFDLSSDPDEKINLARSPAHAGVLNTMMPILTKDWNADGIRARVLENQRNRDLFVAAEAAIQTARNDKNWAWRDTPTLS